MSMRKLINPIVYYNKVADAEPAIDCVRRKTCAAKVPMCSQNPDCLSPN